MNEHLPECLFTLCVEGEDCAMCVCICSSLRACEQRITGAGCTWGHGDCPNGLACPECKRMDALIEERFQGYEDGWSNAFDQILEVVEELPCKCNDLLDYCDGQTDVYIAIEKLREEKK